MKTKFISLLFISFIITSSVAIANDSTSIFKVSIGFNHTRYITKGNNNQSSFSHFGSSASSFNYNDTTSYFPSIIVSLEEHLDKNVGFVFGLGYTRTKLSYTTISKGGYFNPYPPSTTYFSSSTISFTSTPNSFLLNVGLKINIKKFYFCPNVKTTYSFGNAKVTDDYSSGTYTSQTPITTSTKQNYSFGGIGGGLIVGYEYNTHPFPIYIEARADYSSVDQGDYKTFSWDACIGIKLRRTKNLRQRSNLD